MEKENIEIENPQTEEIPNNIEEMEAEKIETEDEDRSNKEKEEELVNKLEEKEEVILCDRMDKEANISEEEEKDEKHPNSEGEETYELENNSTEEINELEIIKLNEEIEQPEEIFDNNNSEEETKEEMKEEYSPRESYLHTEEHHQHHKQKAYLILPNYSEIYWLNIESTLNTLAKGSETNALTSSEFLEIIEYLVTESQMIHYTGNKADLSTLYAFLHLESHSAEYIPQILEDIIPYIAECCLLLPTLFPTGLLPILEQNNREFKSLELTRKQVGCLLACMTLCIIPKQTTTKIPFMRNFYPYYIYYSNYKKPVMMEKLKFLFSYFIQIKEISPEGSINVHRIILNTHPKAADKFYMKNEDKMLAVVMKDGSLSENHESILADFANKYIGGGAIGGGSVQEEILFLNMPELNATRLFCEYMLPHEAICINGLQYYCKHKGYSRGLLFDGVYNDPFFPIQSPEEETKEEIKNEEVKGELGEEELEVREAPKPTIQIKHISRCIVAFDAIHFTEQMSHREQFEPKQIIREINKAYAACLSPAEGEEISTARRMFATGKWGCGAFNGHPQLKFIIQWIAASAAHRKLLFHPFGDKSLENAHKIIKKYKGKAVKVIFRDLMGLATEYKKLLPKIRSKGKTGGSDVHIPDFHNIVFNYFMKA